jgi:EmrB/QacA subfamily drug resistance transporter
MMQAEDAKRTRRTQRLILLNVCIGQTVVGLDQRAITVALPTLTDTFHTAFTTVQWIVLVYDLVLIGLIITMGRLGDLFGRRRFYSIGLLVFVAGSALCGISQTPGQMILFRAIQAIGGSMIAANGRAIVSVALPREERGRALGLTSTAFHIGFLTGPSLGGFLIDTIGWRWIFYINLPIALWGAYLAWKIIPETKAEGKVSVDIAGALLLLLTNALLIYAIDLLPRLGWRHPTFVLTLILSLVAMAFLLVAESKAKTPILILSMFRSRLFAAGVLSLFLVTTSFSAMSYLLPFYLQSLRGYSPSQVGWIIIADSLIIMFMAPIAGTWSDRLGSRLLCTIGCAVIVIAQFLVGSLGLHASLLSIMLPLALWGVGWALFNAPNQSAALGAVSLDKIGAAAGMIATTARTGNAIGVAMASTLFSTMLSAAGLSPAQVESPQSWSAIPESVIGSFNYTIHVINALALLAVFFSAVRGNRRDI